MTQIPPGPGLTYAVAGVDVEAGDRAVELFRERVARTHSPQVVAGLGGFAGLFDASELAGLDHPLLATSTDGVGTKVAIAQAMDRHDTVGQDLVGMVVDDIVVCGARPLFMTDYIACGRVVPERIATLVAGIAAGCELAGCALLGGETAEHPGLLEPDEYDLAGAVTGVVERDKVLGAHRVRPGDVVLALPSSGLHSNGFSLVRRIVRLTGWALDREVPELDGRLGDELLIPTRIYAADLVDLAAALGPRLHALGHVTGGGLAANLARVLPAGTTAVLRRDSWQPAPIFGLLGRLGRVPREDLERTLNQGVGMVAVLAPDAVDAAAARLRGRGLPATPIGEVLADDGLPADADRSPMIRGTKGVRGGAVVLLGEHPAAG